MNNIDFKIGDRVYCHTDLIRFYEEIHFYKKGGMYKILKIEHRIPFFADYSDKYICFTIESEYNMEMDFWISIDNDYDNDFFYLIKLTAYLFDDHFLSLKEHRMLKLNNLSDV